MSIVVRTGVASHVGRVRLDNQDAVLAGPPIFAVADGMGGAAGGEMAAAMALAELVRFREVPVVDASAIGDALRDANTRIRHLAGLDPSHGGMGTTITGLALTQAGLTDGMLVFNVGDSRTYQFRNGVLVQISADHSVVAELIRLGRLSAEQARAHPHRNVVTRALGVGEEVEIDVWLLDPQVGDCYLLCSDGLTNEVAEESIAAALALDLDPQHSADTLVGLALAAGARDNVSVVVVQIVGVQFPKVDDDDETDPRFGVEDTLPPPARARTGAQVVMPDQPVTLPMVER